MASLGRFSRVRARPLPHSRGVHGLGAAEGRFRDRRWGYPAFRQVSGRDPPIGHAYPPRLMLAINQTS
jgi:hypothetical protein